MARSPAPMIPTPADAAAYALDAWQRGVLFLDVMRRRAEQYRAQGEKPAPHVLS